ncbi:hypothetical protein E4U19_004310 [Claviceps sp. Clav32 group G5]|nr:hypothetical protein E4U19_004310 [Claviceps sp. Clav32 group G5]
MTSQSQRDREVFLRDQHDWMDWLIHIEGRACFWHKPTLPGKPKLNEYEKLTELHVTTRHSHLTPAGLAAYKEDMAFYKNSGDDPEFKQECKDDDNEQKAIHHMTELIQSTVAKHLIRTCCRPGQDLKQWMANLKLNSGLDVFYEREKARKRYHSALKPMRNINNWEIWMTEYERAAQDAEDCGVNDMKDLQAVIRDFMTAVAKVASYWNTNFHGTQLFKETMTRQEMMKGFRHHMNEECPESLKMGRTRNTSFATADTAIATAHYENDASCVADGVDHRSPGSKRDASSASGSAPPAKRSKRATKQYPSAQNNSGKKCLACYSPKHRIEGC